MVLIIAMMLAPIADTAVADNTNDNTIITMTTTTNSSTTGTGLNLQVDMQVGRGWDDSSDTPFLECLVISSTSIQWDNATKVAEFLAKEVAVQQANHPSNLVWNHHDHDNDDNSNNMNNNNQQKERK